MNSAQSRPPAGERSGRFPRGRSRGHSQRGYSQRGYSLIEVIVAFALLAGALTVLLGALTGAARQVRQSADAGRAALHAQSLLAQVGVGVPLKPGSDSGEFDEGRYRWGLEVAPWVDPARPPDAALDPAAPTMLELRLGVEWGDGGPRERLLIRSLRLVPADPSGIVAQ